MNKALQSAVHIAITTVLLAIVLRTWLVMGLVEPVTVAGSSMAPTLHGPLAVATCPDCQTKFDVGAEFAASAEVAACPHCGLARVPLAATPLQRGDRLWIDRTLFAWRKPRRWEVVVLRQPDDGNQLCVKRIVALPGETVQLSSGDVWVNERIAVKSLDRQCELRQLVYRSNGTQPRWHAEGAPTWRWSKGFWLCTPASSDQLDWLRYVHLDQQPVSDDVSYNAGVSRRLNLVQDFMLTTEIQVAGAGIFALELNDGRPSLRLTISPSEGTIALSENGRQLISKTLSTGASRRMKEKAIPLVFSNFDRQLLFALDGQTELRYQLAEQSFPTGTWQPVAIGAQRLEVSLKDLTLYRDIYYASAPVGARLPESEAPILLGKDQYFVLGDNSPISVDSRIWGPVPGRLLLGGSAKPQAAASTRARLRFKSTDYRLYCPVRSE